MTGLLVVLLVLALASVFGVWRRVTDGRIRLASDRPGSVTEADRDHARDHADRQALSAAPDADPILDRRPRLSADDIGVPLGERATLLQFSSTFCQPCRHARVVLGQVSASTDGVEHIDLDVADRLDLARQLGVMRTPTTLVLDSRGQEIARAGGVPSVAAVREVVAGIRS